MDGRRNEASPRKSAIRSLDEPFDAVVVGGGVNGCGVAWDAALRGMRVLLVERDDIGSGTSSWSSRLIHGGLKYLEKLDVKLVRESLREREWLLGAAPHLVRPLRMVLPFYTGGGHHPIMLEAGMLAYDALSWDKSVPRHSVWTKRETLRRIPGLESEGLFGAAAYFDAQVELAERLCVEVALAARDAGATVMNHASVERVEVKGGRVSGVEVVDGISGERRFVSASVVMNTAGPWADRVLRGLDEPRLMGGTKGSHFIVDAFPGAPSDALYYEAKSDGRPMMVLPWRGQFMIGSTDERFDGDLDDVGPSEKEISYVLRETNGVFPRANLSADDLLWGYTGVRPLPYTPDDDEGDITRRHTFHDHAPNIEGLVSLVGGKLTTFRQVGEEAANIALEKLGAGKRRSATRRLLLPGAGSMDVDRFTESFAEVSGLDRRIGARLAGLYGSRARGVAERVAESREMREVLDEESGLVAAEVAFAVEEEFAESLTDILARRTMVGIGPTLPEESVERVAKAAARTSVWSDERVERELRGYRGRLDRFRIPGSIGVVI